MIEMYRNETKKHDYKDYVKFDKFICISPASSREPKGKLPAYDKGGKIKELKVLKEEKEVGGAKRVYNATIWEVPHGGKKMLLMAEFASPLASLAGVEIGMQTQISKKAKDENKERFDKLMELEIEEGTKKGSPLQHCRLFTFDGKVNCSLILQLLY